MGLSQIKKVLKRENWEKKAVVIWCYLSQVPQGDKVAKQFHKVA